MGDLTSTEIEAVERAAEAPMLDQVLGWAAVLVNSQAQSTRPHSRDHR